MEHRIKIKRFLGLRKTQSESGIFMDQLNFIKEVWRKLGKENCKPSKTPAEVNFKLENADEQEYKNDETAHRDVVASLLYVSKQTRPDITSMRNHLSRHMQSPT